MNRETPYKCQRCSKSSKSERIMIILSKDEPTGFIYCDNCIYEIFDKNFEKSLTNEVVSNKL
jgi:DNA-directed RNA polymerase subunit RPC12/RpoP